MQPVFQRAGMLGLRDSARQVRALLMGAEESRHFQRRGIGILPMTTGETPVPQLPAVFVFSAYPTTSYGNRKNGGRVF